jgi:hypothetical protein
LGIRYADYLQGGTDLTVPETVLTGWQGWGGTVGLEAKRSIGFGSLYARGRLAALVGDSAAVSVTPFGVVPIGVAAGTTVTQTELGIGYEAAGCFGRALVTGRVGAEWQNWSNVMVLGTGDAGWAGFMFSLGVEI